MSELKLTKDKMKVYSEEDGKGVFKTSSRLEKLGEKQNDVNELLAANINELIKRVCALEDEKIKQNEIMKKLASELASLKAEVDRLKLTAKLNTNAIDRMNNAINSASDAGSNED